MKKIFSLLLFWLLAGTMAFSQVDTVQIGTGTGTSNHPLPGFSGWNHDVTMYSADEINSSSGFISHIAYNLSAATTTSANKMMKIYMMTTSDTSLTSSLIPNWNTLVAQAELVYESQNSTDVAFSAGWNWFELDESFYYNGTENLLILIEGKACTTGGGCTPAVYSNTTSTNMHWCKRKDNSALTGLEEGTFTTANRADIQMVINQAVLTCVNVSDLTASNIAHDNVDITWSAGGTESSWLVSYKEYASETWGDEEEVWSTSYDFFDNPLTPNTQYKCRVRALCGTGDTSAYRSVSFRTTCDPSLPFIEYFDNAAEGSTSSLNAPDCWSYFKDNAYAHAYVSSASPYSFPHCYYLYNNASTSTQKTALVSPLINEDLSDLRIQFFAKGSTSGYRLHVGYLTTDEDMSTFTLLQNISLTDGWAQYVVDFASIDTLPNTVTNIVFLHGNTLAYQPIYIDDIIIDRIPLCGDVVVSDFDIFDLATLTSITLNSSDNAPSFDSYMLKYRKVNTIAWSDEEQAIFFPYTITNLEPGSNYEIMAKRLCEEGESFWSSAIPIGWTAFEVPLSEVYDANYPTGKDWSLQRNNTAGSISSTTTSGDYYSSPRALSMSNGTTANSHVNYYVSPKIDPDVSINTLQIRFKAKANAMNMSMAVGIMNSDDINSFELMEALPLSTTWGTYIVSFENYAGADARIAIGHLKNHSSSSIYFDDIHIELIQSCPEIANITYTNLNHEGITLTWRDDDASSYTIKYVEVGETDTTTVPVSGVNTYTITGLSTMTDYMVTLSSSCESDVWSSNHIFTTTMVAGTIPFNENFEGTNHPFVFKNGTQPNKWIVGTDPAAQPTSGTSSLYISNDNSTYTYGHSTSKVYAYTALNFVSEGSYKIEYDWQSRGEANKDYAQIWLAPAGATFSVGSSPATTGWINVSESNLNGATSWQHKNSTFNVQNTGIYNLVMYWENDATGGSTPPVAIDNISIVKNPCDNIISIETSNSTANSVDIIFNTFASTTDARLYYRTMNNLTWTDSVDVDLTSLTDNTYTLSDLNSGTVYYCAARSICSSSTSGITSSLLFLTTCEPSELPWMEDFTLAGFPPSICWERKSGLYTPNATVYTANLANSTSWTRKSVNENPAAQINIQGSSTYHWLISPIFQLEEDNDYNLSLDLLYSNNTTGSSAPANNIADDKFIILFSTDGGESWEPQNRVTWTANETGDYRLDSLTNTYTTFNFSLTRYSGDIRIAFYGESTISGSNNYLSVDNISIAACSRPSELTVTDITPQSATISWASNAENASFEYVISENSSTPDENEAVSTNERSVDFDDLTDNTNYYFFVRTNCGGDNSEWASVNFRTNCFPITQSNFLETFEDTSSTVHCWRVIDNNDDGDKWDRFSSSEYARNGSHSYRLYTDNNRGNNDDYLISPQITVTGNEYVKFYARAHSIIEPNDLQVLISTTGREPSDFTLVAMPLTVIGTITYEEYIADLSSVSGDIYFAFHVPAGGLDGWNIYIDDVSIEQYSGCINPTNLAIANFDANQATVTWNLTGFAADVTDIQLIHGECGIDTLTATPVVLLPTDTSYVLTNLTHQTCYDIYVKSTCTEATNWVKIQYTTPCEPFTLPFFEDFESTSPSLDCWDVVNLNDDNYTWELNTANPYSGLQSFSIYTDRNAGNNDDYLISPPLQLTGNDILTYFAKVESMIEPNDYRILFSTTGNSPANFTTILHAETLNNTSYQEREILLPAHSGVGYIAFHIPQRGLDGKRLYIDDVYVSPIPTCPVPTNVEVTVLDHESIEVSWNRNEDGTETAWEIAVDLEGFDINNFTGTVVSATDSIWPVSNLTPNTSYDIYVRAVCNDPNDTWWSRKKTFTTDCAPLTTNDLPYSESFDTYGTGNLSYPTCWNKISTTNYPNIHTTHHTSPGALLFYRNNSANVIAIAQAFDASIDVSNLEVRFAMHTTDVSAGLYVGVMTDKNSASTFTPIDTIRCGNTDAFQNFTTYLDGYTGGGKYIAFKYFGSASSVYLDDVVIDMAQSCHPVTNLDVAYNETTNEVSLSWISQGDETQWEIIYSTENGFDPNVDASNATSTFTSTNPAIISGLSVSGLYTFYVRAICAAGDSSEWNSNPGTVYIGTCLAPANLTVSSIESRSATVSWTAGGTETAWDVEYRKDSETAYRSDRVMQTTKALTNLDPNTLYHVRVRAICEIDIDYESEYTDTTFTTLPASAIEYTITPSVEGSGSVNPSSAVQVVEGGSQTFTFTPGANYELSQVLVDNVATSYDTTGRSYTFANVQANHTIKGVFTLIGSVDDYVLNNRVIIYPNPANSTVNVKTEVMFQTVEITNMLGQVIHTSSVNDTHFQLNVSHLNAGVYFIRLQGENGTAVKKLRVEN